MSFRHPFIVSQLAAFSFIVGAFPLSAASAAKVRMGAPTEYRGLADVSGGVALDRQHFVIVDDEEGVMRVYSRSGDTRPVGEKDLGDVKALRVPGAKKECIRRSAVQPVDSTY